MHPLPRPFVQATLAALDLPRHLAERYAAPDPASARPVRHRASATPALVRPAPAPAWPFPRR